MRTDEERLEAVAAARTGDARALDRLLRLYQPDIRRYAQRHCMISDVDDAVQEVLLIVSRKVASVRVLAAFSGWLFAVVRRECRRLGRNAFNFDPFDEERVERWLERNSNETLRLELIAALESLPADYRDVILMRDFEELTISEIAARLKMSVPATKSRLHRARVMAREYLVG
ncbi:RNA polymerase sigma factor [Burkholderia anthina]|uniref:RNA polymerase sigma factor n=1 Tax=Burkholderia anthina TaxID=179879 RepID=UPI00075C31BB|nr:sigma-70 family RNA polymerase sigma factor [Burkholderia anthina]KVN53141.1 RNA polymerase subunit sigma-24 [Burkholderia anthina]